MKNKISILLIPSIIISFFIGCYTLGGSRGASSNIKESKERGVFICEYTTAQNPYSINDSIIIDIDEMWLEKRWAYGSSVDETLSIPYFQLIIVAKDEESFKNYRRNWYAGINRSLYLREAGKKSLMSDFTSLPPDTISIPVQREGRVAEHQKKDIIGVFEIHRK